MTASAAGTRRPIRPLDEATVRQISAGEVVDRPASVVKELVENAYDADAREVVVRIEGGGLERIEVSDDGFGIVPEELGVAVERHTTSKLSRPAELESIATLGFRGEALAAIGSVSHLRILSRRPDEEEAHGISLMAGTLAGQFVAGRPPGTTVEVRELFFNTPARRKFLRSPASEQVEVVSVLEHLYLARSTVSVSLFVDDREVLRLPSTGDLSDAAARILGPEFGEHSIDMVAAGPGGLEMEAQLGRPVLSRPTSQGLYLSVNGRSIESRSLAQAVRLAYAEYLPRGRYPVGVLRLTVRPGRIDVNVHPTKREVRLVHEREVADAIRHAVRTALLEGPQVHDVPGGLREDRFVPTVATRETRVLETEQPIRPSGPGERPSAPPGGEAGRRAQRLLEPLPGRVEVVGDARHPALHLVGALMDLYWVAESGEALLLIDQHAASERVIFEELRREGRLGSQRLLEPVTVTLGARLRIALEEHRASLEAAGFTVDAFGPESFRVRSVPSYRGRRARPESLALLLEELAAGGRPTVPSGGTDRIAASIACHAAVRAGDRIGPEEMGRILEALYRLPDESYACPHGRPILLRFSRGQLDRWFLRARS